MNAQKSLNKETKIDGAQAIYDYVNCHKIISCEECECHKQITELKHFNTLCDFLRTYTATARDKINKVLDTVL